MIKVDETACWRDDETVNTFVAEASSLGWPPGGWPNDVELGKRLLIRTDEPGAVVRYRSHDGLPTVSLLVLND